MNLSAAKTAPVALFVYARPQHTRRTVEALAANEGAAATDLIIFSDAAKDEQALPAVREVRQYVASITGFRSVTVHEQDRNLGLADSIINGVSSVVAAHGAVIALEDDIVTSPYFLRYMNDALRLYAQDEQVMHIAGHMFPINTAGLPETFFMRQSSCWGWATWARAWKHFTRDSASIMERFSGAAIRRFNLDGTMDYWSQLLANQRGDLRTWAVFWYASIFMRKGLCLHPRESLTRNIGFDGSGENCGSLERTEEQLAAEPITVQKIKLHEDKVAMKRLERFLSKSDTLPKGKYASFFLLAKKHLPAFIVAILRIMKMNILNCFFKKTKQTHLENSSPAPQQLWRQDATTRIFPSATIQNTQNNPDSISFGKNTYIRGEFFIFAHGGNISVGDYCYVGEGTRIWSSASVRIGDRVLISHNVNIFDSDTHPIDDPKARHEQFKAIITTGHPPQIDLQEEPVVIENDVLICCQCIILKGVTIGEGAVVGAGSVVTRDVEPYTLVAGNPARVIRKLNPPHVAQKD